MQLVLLYVDQIGGILIVVLVLKVCCLKCQRGFDFLIVDYIQLLFGLVKNFGNWVQEIIEIIIGFKVFVKELNVLIIVLFQFFCQVEVWDDKWLMMLDLCELGFIEQDVDVVLFVFCEEYYLFKIELDEGFLEYEVWCDNMEWLKGKVEIIIVKQCYGLIGIVNLYFEGQYICFFDLVDMDYLLECYEQFWVLFCYY